MILLIFNVVCVWNYYFTIYVVVFMDEVMELVLNKKERHKYMYMPYL